MTVLFTMSCVLFCIPVTGQAVNYSVEVECDDETIEVESEPGNIVTGYLDCTFTNPSIHLEKIQYQVNSDYGGVTLIPRQGTLDLNGGESKILTIGITPNEGLWTGNYELTVYGTVVEVWGAPPPSYETDMDTGTYYVSPYLDFDPVSCWSSFSDDTYSLVDVGCWVENRGNTHDEYSLVVPQSAIDAMESFGFKSTPALSQSVDWFTYDIHHPMIEGGFVFEGDTSEWRDNDTLYSLNEVILVELHSQGAESEGSPLIEQASVPIQLAIEKEIVEDQYAPEGFLFAPGMIELLVVLLVAVAVARPHQGDENGDIRNLLTDRT